jgi:hypothetical protein
LGAARASCTRNFREPLLPIRLCERYLILKSHRPDAALAAWEQTADVVRPLRLPAHRGQPGRERRFQPRHPEWRLRLDLRRSTRSLKSPCSTPSAFRQGHRSLLLDFRRPGDPRRRGSQELIPVRGPTTYDFSAYYKSAGFEGAGGPQIVLRDAYTGARRCLPATHSTTPASGRKFTPRLRPRGSTTLLRAGHRALPGGLADTRQAVARRLRTFSRGFRPAILPVDSNSSPKDHPVSSALATPPESRARR